MEERTIKEASNLNPKGGKTQFHVYVISSNFYRATKTSFYKFDPKNKKTELMQFSDWKIASSKNFDYSTGFYFPELCKLLRRHTRKLNTYLSKRLGYPKKRHLRKRYRDHILSKNRLHFDLSIVRAVEVIAPTLYPVLKKVCFELPERPLDNAGTKLIQKVLLDLAPYFYPELCHCFNIQPKPRT